MVKVFESEDHKETGKSKLLAQYKNSQNFVRLSEIFLEEMNNLEAVYGSWFEKLDIDTATGVNLDYWAELLDSDNRPFGDTPRPDNDDVYRSLIYAVIGAYNSNGTAAAIQSTLLQVLKADRIFIDDNLDASFSFEVDNPTFIFSKEIIANIVRIAKPVGVEFLGYTISNIYDEPTFGFLEDPDEQVLGFAVLASGEVTSQTWVNYRCAPAGGMIETKRIETVVDQLNQTATLSLYVPPTASDGTLGATFLNDIQTEFNGVIGSKIGFDYEFVIPPLPPTPSENIDQINSFSFPNPLGMPVWNGSDIPYAIVVEDGSSGLYYDKCLSFYGDESFLTSVETELKQKWFSGQTLTIYDKIGDRYDFVRTTTSDDYIFKDYNNYAFPANGLPTTSLNQPYKLPSADNVPSGDNFHITMVPGQQFDLGGGTLIVFATGLNFYIYTAEPNAVQNFLNFVSEFTNHVGRSFTIIGKDGDEMKFVNKRLDNDPLAVIDGANNVRLIEAIEQDGYKNYILYTGGNANGEVPPQEYMDVYLNGVNMTTDFYRNPDGNIAIDYDPIYYRGPNYSSLKQIFDTNNALDINIYDPEGTVAFPTSSTGFVNNRQGFALCMYDAESDTQTANCFVNGVQVSPRVAFNGFSTYLRSNTYHPQNQNTILLSDKPQPFDNFTGTSYRYPYTFYDINVESGFSSEFIVSIFYGSVDFYSNLNCQSQFQNIITDLFDTNRVAGNNIVLYDLDNNKWKFEIPEDFSYEFDLVNAESYEENYDSDQQGEGYDFLGLKFANGSNTAPSSYLLNVYKNDVLIPTGSDLQDGGTYSFTPYGEFDGSTFEQNNPNGITGELKPVIGSWLLNNLSTFDIVTSETTADYVKINVEMSKNGTDNVALLENGTPTVISALSSDQLDTLNVNTPAIIDPLIKQTEEGDGEIPEEGFATKGGGRFSLLNL